MSKDKPSADRDSQITTPTYRGPDRRAPADDTSAQPTLTRRVRFDAKGNPVWEVRVDTPARRADDDTVDLLKCLEPDSLSLVDDDDVSEPE